MNAERAKSIEVVICDCCGEVSLVLRDADNEVIAIATPADPIALATNLIEQIEASQPFRKGPKRETHHEAGHG